MSSPSAKFAWQMLQRLPPMTLHWRMVWCSSVSGSCLPSMMACKASMVGAKEMLPSLTRRTTSLARTRTLLTFFCSSVMCLNICDKLLYGLVRLLGSGTPQAYLDKPQEMIYIYDNKFYKLSQGHAKKYGRHNKSQH